MVSCATSPSLSQNLEVIVKWSLSIFNPSIFFLEKSEAEGDSYTPMLNDMIIVTPQFLGT